MSAVPSRHDAMNCPRVGGSPPRPMSADDAATSSDALDAKAAARSERKAWRRSARSGGIARSRGRPAASAGLTMFCSTCVKSAVEEGGEGGGRGTGRASSGACGPST
eukprot:7322775-Prymnesium_polylepis.1